VAKLTATMTINCHRPNNCIHHPTSCCWAALRRPTDLNTRSAITNRSGLITASDRQRIDSVIDSARRYGTARRICYIRVRWIVPRCEWRTFQQGCASASVISRTIHVYVLHCCHHRPLHHNYTFCECELTHTDAAHIHYSYLNSVRFMQIFAGVRWRIENGVVENGDFRFIRSLSSEYFTLHGHTTAFRWYDCQWPWPYCKVIGLFHIKFLKNGAWYGKSYYRQLIGNHTLTFDWCHFWWPWSRPTFEGPFKDSWNGRGGWLIHFLVSSIIIIIIIIFYPR